MKKFLAKHARLLTRATTFLMAFSAMASTRCVAFVWHDEPKSPAFMKNDWENEI